MVYTRNILAALAVALPAYAQTYTTCNPTEKSCDPDTALSSTSFSTTWTSSSSLGNGWSSTAGNVTFGDDGALFTINKAGDAPTIQTDFYIFFGSLEVTMKAAPGQGIVSSIVFLSDDLDEIDWEFTGTDTTQVQSNYYGKGNTTTYDRAVWQTVSDPQATEHTYLIDWTKDAITWSIDGNLVRTLAYADANGGANFPQTPMRIRLGPWAGGAAGNPEGTIEWAGGETDFSKAPFTMSVSKVTIKNYSPGSEYVWKDKTGSYESIQVISGSGASGSAGVFAPSQTSEVPISSTTVAAGTTVKQSTTKVASSISASTVTTGAQLSTIPLKGSTTLTSTTSHTSSHASSTRAAISAGTTGSSSGSHNNGTTTSAAPSSTSGQSDTSAAVALGSNGIAVVALALFVVSALALV